MKIINNKKGQADLIGNVLKLIPKPIIFLFFLLLFSVIIALLSPVFNGFGIFCNSDKEVIKLPNTNIITNIRLMGSMPDASEIGGESIEPNKLGVKCKEYYNDSFRFWNYGGGDCHNCPTGIIEGLGSASYEVCKGDAFNWVSPLENLSFWNRRVICPLITCDIPENYFFNADTGLYECLTNCESQTLATERDSKLTELGGYPYYADDFDDGSYRGLMSFGCNKKLQVVPTIKGIEIFNLKYWAIGVLIMILLIGIIKFGKK